MIIRYKDITLRAIEENDLELLREMINDPDIENVTGGASFPISMWQQRKWFESLNNSGKGLRLMIDVPEHGTIGMAALTDIDYKNGTAEFHAKIAASAKLRGKGYGKKVYAAMVNYAFDQLNLNCICTYNLRNNIATEKVKESLGFVREGILRQRIYKNGQYNDLVAWSITRQERDEWQKMHPELK